MHEYFGEIKERGYKNRDLEQEHPRIVTYKDWIIEGKIENTDIDLRNQKLQRAENEG